MKETPQLGKNVEKGKDSTQMGTGLVLIRTMYTSP
jgi:hypothetical protein